MNQNKNVCTSTWYRLHWMGFGLSLSPLLQVDLDHTRGFNWLHLWLLQNGVPREDLLNACVWLCDLEPFTSTDPTMHSIVRLILYSFQKVSERGISWEFLLTPYQLHAVPATSIHNSLKLTQLYGIVRFHLKSLIVGLHNVSE